MIKSKTTLDKVDLSKLKAGCLLKVVAKQNLQAFPFDREEAFGNNAPPGWLAKRVLIPNHSIMVYLGYKTSEDKVDVKFLYKGRIYWFFFMKHYEMDVVEVV